MIHTLIVTCCGHPDNEYDWIPGAVWSCSWDSGREIRFAPVTISQVVPLTDDEPPRFIDDRGPDARPLDYRERINETCAACGQALVMRDDTWNELSRRLEMITEIWRPDGRDTFVATVSLQMMARLAEAMRGRGQQGRG